MSSGTHLSQTQGRDKIQDTDNSENIRNEEATSFAKISQFSIHTSLTLGCGLGWQGRQGHGIKLNGKTRRLQGDMDSVSLVSSSLLLLKTAARDAQMLPVHCCCCFDCAPSIHYYYRSSVLSNDWIRRWRRTDRARKELKNRTRSTKQIKLQSDFYQKSCSNAIFLGSRPD